MQAYHKSNRRTSVAIHCGPAKGWATDPQQDGGRSWCSLSWLSGSCGCTICEHGYPRSLVWLWAHLMLRRCVLLALGPVPACTFHSRPGCKHKLAHFLAIVSHMSHLGRVALLVGPGSMPQRRGLDFDGLLTVFRRRSSTHRTPHRLHNVRAQIVGHWGASGHARWV